MENPSQLLDEVMLQFESVFMGIPAAMLLKNNEIWSTCVSPDIDNYNLVFLYEGNGHFQLTVLTESAGSDIQICIPNTNDTAPSEGYAFQDRKTNCRRSEHGLSHMNFK